MLDAVVADFTMLEPLMYAQLATGQRKDLTFFMIDAPVTLLKHEQVQGWLSNGRPIWLLDPYGLEMSAAELERVYVVKPATPFGYLLQL
jgi:hypothetical protein